jgi:hypothetical protein
LTTWKSKFSLAGSHELDNGLVIRKINILNHAKFAVVLKKILFLKLSKWSRNFPWDWNFVKLLGLLLLCF